MEGKKEKQKPVFAGEKWTDEEEVRLRSEFEEGMNYSEIARRHKRTRGAIVSRLKKMGLIAQ